MTVCDFCTDKHPEDTSCNLPYGTAAWVTWRFKGEEPVTRVLPCDSKDDAAFWAAAILEQFGKDAFDSFRHYPRVVGKAPERYPQGRARILRLMSLDG